MLKQKDGKWVFVSSKTQRPLAYYRGEGKPSDDWVKKQEARVQYFKHMNEASYAGNIGMMELVKFHRTATPEQKKTLDTHIKNKNHKKVWDLVQSVTKTKLHKSIYESQSKDILSVSGAGQEGTDILVKNYINSTPGQKLRSFKDHTKNK
jgi:hypothetical protein